MKKTTFSLVAVCIAAIMLNTGCGMINEDMPAQDDNLQESSNSLEEDITVVDEPIIKLTSKITELENSFSAVSFNGDDGFEDFLLAGGASSDADNEKK